MTKHITAVVFIAGATLTALGCASMAGMGGMPMPGGWTLSMTWIRMPTQTWAAFAVSFLGMWTVMMAPMMLPSLLPMLTRYRRTVQGTKARLGFLTTLVGLGYFVVWAIAGMAAFALGVALTTAEMQWPALARAVPLMAATVVLMAGALQFTDWKARHLACCREAPGHDCTRPAGAGTAWRHGLRLGLHCGRCCVGSTAILLSLGVMDLRVMAAATAAITAERFASDGRRAARAIGVIMVGVGLFLAARAATLPLAAIDGNGLDCCTARCNPHIEADWRDDSATNPAWAFNDGGGGGRLPGGPANASSGVFRGRLRR